jgi:hypothetical protein
VERRLWLFVLLLERDWLFPAFPERRDDVLPPRDFDELPPEPPADRLLLRLEERELLALVWAMTTLLTRGVVYPLRGNVTDRLPPHRGANRHRGVITPRKQEKVQ